MREDKGIIIENGTLIDELTKIRECWVFKKIKENKNRLKIEKHLEMMNAKQSEIRTEVEGFSQRMQ